MACAGQELTNFRVIQLNVSWDAANAYKAGLAAFCKKRDRSAFTKAVLASGSRLRDYGDRMRQVNQIAEDRGLGFVPFGPTKIAAEDAKDLAWRTAQSSEFAGPEPPRGPGRIEWYLKSQLPRQYRRSRAEAMTRALDAFAAQGISKEDALAKMAGYDSARNQALEEASGGNTALLAVQAAALAGGHAGSQEIIDTMPPEEIVEQGGQALEAYMEPAAERPNAEQQARKKMADRATSNPAQPAPGRRGPDATRPVPVNRIITTYTDQVRTGGPAQAGWKDSIIDLIKGQGGEPEEWARLPYNSTYGTLARMSGKTMFAQVLTPALNTFKGQVAHWAYSEDQGATWKIALNLRPDVAVAGPVGPALTEGGTGVSIPPQTGTGVMPVQGAAGCGPMMGPIEPMMTTRRTCGRGRRLGVDGMCWPTRMLPAALRMNRSKKAYITWSDWRKVTDGARTLRKLKRLEERGREFQKLIPKAPRRRRIASRSEKK